MSDDAPAKRPIRSFVRREGRLTAGQQRALEEGWPRWGLDYRDTPLDFTEVFGNSRPVWLEVGFGNGETLIDLATRHRDGNYVGIEVHAPGVGHLLRRVDELGLDNVRALRHDAVEVIDHMIPDHSLAGVFLFFPDPWHKKRHHKRRLVQDRFAASVARILRPGGLFHAATDWEDYAQHMMATFERAAGQFENTAGSGRFAGRPEWRPQTKFEQRGRRLGHGVWDLIFRRIDA